MDFQCEEYYFHGNVLPLQMGHDCKDGKQCKMWAEIARHGLEGRPRNYTLKEWASWYEGKQL